MIDVIVIGGGINGLVAATALAREKRSVLVLDRRDIIGGASITSTSPNSFKTPTLSHSLGPLSADVMRTLQLDGPDSKVKFLLPDPVLTTLGRSGEIVSFHRDDMATAASINLISTHDAGAWQTFAATMQRLAAVMAKLNQHTPPSIEAPSSTDLWHLLALGQKTRSLGRLDLARLARYAPIAVADLVAEWFDNDLVQAAVAVRGVFGHHAGPWSAGTGALLLRRIAEDPIPVGGGATMVGGPGALSQALLACAEAAGAQVRTQARVAQVLTRGNVATGVVLDTGEEIAAQTVVGAIDPRHLCIDLINPADLAPSFLQRMRQVRGRGVTAKVNLSLLAKPAFTSLHGDDHLLKGRILIAPGIDYVERAFDAAKYGKRSPQPWLEISIPTISDPSLAPEGQHIMSIYVHYAPRFLAEGTWTDQRDALYRSVIDTLTMHAPGIAGLVVEREVITPEDLETEWGLPGGHIFHGEETLDQWWISRPVLGASQYETPLERLYFASAGTHPGGGLTGQSGLNAARVISRALKRRR